MNSLVKTLYSNQAILDNKKLKWPFTLLIFLISVMLIATPFVLGRFLETPEKLLNQYEGVAQPMMKILNNYNCEFSDKKIICLETHTRFNDGEYVVEFLPEINQEVEDIGDNYIVVMKDYISFGYRGNELQGDYTYLEGASFKKLLELQRDEKLSDETLVGHFLQNISQSNTSNKIPIIYLSMFLMYIMYVAIISAIFMLINGKQLERPFSYGDVITMVVLTMFTPALICAIWGLFRPEIASAICPLLIMVRLMFVYNKMLKVK